MTAIAATSYTSRILVDGTLAMTIHIDPPFRDAAIALFGAPGSEMALAALKAAAPAQETPKGGAIANWCALRCKEAAFQKWLSKTYLSMWGELEEGSDALNAARVVREVCCVESRSEFDNDKAAASRFDRLIRRPYMEASA